MVEKIYEIKNKLLEQLSKELENKGAERIDPEMVDMVKDLAEAEKNCWEADYYRSVSEAMESSGYMPGYTANQPNYNGMQGYMPGYMPRDSQGRYMSRRGYHDPLESVREAMKTASPEEREKMQRELRTMLGM